MTLTQSRELFLLIRQLIRKNAALFSRESAGLDLTPEQWIVLQVIDNRQSMTQKAVSELTHKDTSTLTRVLDQLERKELVTRSPHKKDRRAITLNSTPRGHAVAAEAILKEKHLHEEIMSGITDTEFESVKNTCIRILKNMKRLD